ncbi:hypothetical protein [Marinoscillum sp.]|uniref:hypothetical protein n=1 Tax=Marinoscillum sp. TaxID=2024838 RepID=UPI003BA8DA40
MNDTLYYGEMVAKISARLHQNPDHAIRIARTLNATNDPENSVWTLCADAARVFDKIEDLGCEYFIDWLKAIDHYASKILDLLLSGYKPNTLDMVSMAAQSIEKSK